MRGNFYADTISRKIIIHMYNTHILIISLFFLFLILYQVYIGPLGNNPAPNWVLTIIFLVFLFLSYNFIRLINQITPEFLIISYGIIKHKIVLDTIEDIKLNESSFLKYGGWGIRFGNLKGKDTWLTLYPEHLT